MSRPLTPSQAIEAQEVTASLATLAPIARSSVVDAVSARLQQEILAGRLAAGARLPSERDLSVALGVNRLTLRAALSRLEAQGLIVTRHGAPTTVASWRERAGLETLSLVLGSLSRDDDSWHEVVVALLEVRRAMVAEAIALAALRHTPADLQHLRELAAAQRDRLDDVLAFARGDIAFQRAMLRAAHNVGFELVLNSFARFPEEQPELVAMLYDQRSVEFYEVALGILETRDAAGARELVRSALEAVDAVWMQRHRVRAPRTTAKAQPSLPTKKSKR